MGIKNSPKKNKIIKNGAPEKSGCSSDQHPFFSFRYMTKNSNHSIAYLKSCTMPVQLETLHNLYTSMEIISMHPWAYWGNLSKRTGYETIAFAQIRFGAGGDVRLTGDTKLFIFRFDTSVAGKSGRIIGFKDSPCSAFNVIGYDFDFTAYKHE